MPFNPLASNNNNASNTGTQVKRNFIFFILVAIFTSSCGIFEYARGVADEAHNLAVSRRRYINELDFIGIIKNKEILDKTYQILIEKVGVGHIEPFSNLEYYSYFSSKKTILNISVTKELFENANANDIIVKLSHTDSVFVRNKPYKFYDW